MLLRFSAFFLLFLCAHVAVWSATPGSEETVNEISIVDSAAIPATNGDSVTIIRLLPDVRKLLLQPGVLSSSAINVCNNYRNSALFGGVEPIFELADAGRSSVVKAELVTTADGETFLALQWHQIGRSVVTIRSFNPETGEIYIERVTLEAWTPNFIAAFLTVLGGLGLFLIGMRFMSEGLQMVAGSTLRRMIATLTSNRFTATGVGFLVTATIQSSTVTTVMVVGFVNSQVMTLSQGIGVIMGANIGTTLTAWILTLNLGAYGLAIIGCSAFFYMFAKNEWIRYLGMAAVGLGALFFGLETMQQGFRPLSLLPEFTAWMAVFSADTYLGIMGCVLVGCVLTMILQSSTATIGITIALAAIGVIDFQTAAALIIGENLGTTFTALLVSIGVSANARRAAYFHVLFNVVGVLYITALFLPFMVIIKSIIGVDEDGVILNSTAGLALTHTLFNVFNTILFLPFTRVVADLLIKYVPDDAGTPTKPRRTKLAGLVAAAPSIAIERSQKEVQRMGYICQRLAERVLDIVKSETPFPKSVDDSLQDEEFLDSLRDEVIEFTSSMLHGNISKDVATSARKQLCMAEELERISDYLIAIMKSDLNLRRSELSLPEPEKSEIIGMHDTVIKIIKMIVRYHADRKSGSVLSTDVKAQGKDITQKVKEIRNNFMQRMSDENFAPQVVLALNTQLNSYRQLKRHAQRIAKAIGGEK